ncbi:hypothetical protein D3C79_868410 [compost metagenome]
MLEPQLGFVNGVVLFVGSLGCQGMTSLGRITRAIGHIVGEDEQVLVGQYLQFQFLGISGHRWGSSRDTVGAVWLQPQTYRQSDTQPAAKPFLSRPLCLIKACCRTSAGYTPIGRHLRGRRCR